MDDEGKKGERKILGDRGEGLAETFLIRKGHRILEKNLRTPAGEIDLVTRHGDTLVFVEVKTRESVRFGRPFEAVDARKRRKLSRSALYYLSRLARRGKEIPPCRFDVLSISGEEDDYRVDHIEDAFEAE